VSTGTLAVANGGTGTTTSTGTGSVVLQSSPTITGNLTFGSATGACFIGGGGYDNATLTQYNLKIQSWYGIGFPDYGGFNRITLDTRTGNIIHTGDIQSPVLVGQVSFFARNTAPTGWLKANGAAISRTTYAALFAAISTTFGAGDSSTTFLIPDLRGEFIRGWADNRTGVPDSGRTFGSFQDEAFKSHNHYVNEGPYTGGGNSIAVGSSASYVDNAYTNYAGGSETRPRNLALLACIKY
jgi:microcystin-dependent protein